MDMTKKIKLAEVYAGLSETEVAKRLEKTPQAFGQRVRTGKFTSQELEEIAGALGAKFVCYFEFPDGEKI